MCGLGWGAARDLTAEERKGHCEMQWDDPLVCACFLVNFCPHDLFVNTKSDLGMLVQSLYPLNPFACPPLSNKNLCIEICTHSLVSIKEGMIIYLHLYIYIGIGNDIIVFAIAIKTCYSLDMFFWFFF